MLKGYTKKLIISNKEFILKEVLAAKGLMQLLMKPRNTGQKWTAEEKREVIIHLKRISKTIPVVVIFCLPFGSLFLPILIEMLDRRKINRLSKVINSTQK